MFACQFSFTERLIHTLLDCVRGQSCNEFYAKLLLLGLISVCAFTPLSATGWVFYSLFSGD